MQADRGTRSLIRLCVIIAIVVTAVRIPGLTGAPKGAQPPVQALALLIIWAGIALRSWAFLTLGRYFTFTVMSSPEQPVISSGPYRFLRHPGYAGLELIFIGLGVAFGNWIALAVWTLVPLIGLLVRMRVEEKALSTARGDAYRSYAAGRKRIIPFVW